MDCAEGLNCFHRNVGGPKPPGCVGTLIESHDYCYDPEDSPSGKPSVSKILFYALKYFNV